MVEGVERLEVCGNRKHVLILYSYQDENTRALFMVYGSYSWFTIRIDLLSSFFLTAVALVAVLSLQNPGNIRTSNKKHNEPI